MNCFRQSKGLSKLLIKLYGISKEKNKNWKNSESTFPIYFKFIKLFCDVNDIIINRKIVSRGIAKGRYA